MSRRTSALRHCRRWLTDPPAWQSAAAATAAAAADALPAPLYDARRGSHRHASPTAPPARWPPRHAGGGASWAAAAVAGAPRPLSSSPAVAAPPEPEPLPEPPTWVDRLPRSWQPFARLSRLDKPTGTLLLAWPCLWSAGLAAPAGAAPDAALLALFGAGAVLLRGAGCTINDLWDRDLDARVARTRSRPLPSGAATPAAAAAWAAAQLAAGAAVLAQLNPYTQALGAASLPLVAAYPAAKRVTRWPQAVLGLTINWGALVGWAAVRGGLDPGVVLPLYLSAACWTLVYDTIYAHQDVADDAEAGVYSMALTLGGRARAAMAGLVAANGALLAAAGAAAGCGAPYAAGAAAAVGHLAWQVAAVDLGSPADCAAKFRGTWVYGAALTAGVFADRLLAAA